MTILIKSLTVLAVLAVALFLTSCHTEDPGPLQEDRRDYNRQDFDRLEMGDAFDIEVRQGTFFAITARGDERNLDDLEVKTEGTTLVIRYNNQKNRKHTTYIEITMPTLVQVNFTGATKSTVTGFTFTGLESLRVSLSGASKSEIEVDAAAMDVALSGASKLTLAGTGDALSANASGASELQAFGYAVSKADVNASGASRCKVSVTDALRAVASGASSVIYRGSPAVDGNSSGGSTIGKD